MVKSKSKNSNGEFPKYITKRKLRHECLIVAEAWPSRNTISQEFINYVFTTRIKHKIDSLYIRKINRREFGHKRKLLSFLEVY